MVNRSERDVLVALLQDRPGGATWRALTDEVAECGSAVKVYEHRVAADLFGGDDEHAKRFEQAADLIDQWEADGIGVHTLFDDTFPVQLRDVLHMPPLVFTRGTVEPDTRAVAIVGSRKATTEGLHNAARLATGLAEHGFTIVSGGAAGIDSAAHEAALAAGVRTGSRRGVRCGRGGAGTH
jgi:DNA processing protein